MLRKVLDIVNHVLICRVVDENIDGTHFRYCFLDELCAVLLLPEVRRELIAFPSVLLDLFLGFIGVLLFFGQIGDDAIGTFHGEENSDCTSDTRVSTCDDGFLPL